PTSRFFFNVHLDGMEATHDRAVEREGVFKAAVEGIRAAKRAGFLVCTNTTIYKETDIAEIDELYAFLTRLGRDGVMQSPAYRYAAVCETIPDGAAEIFLTRDEVRGKFREAEKLLKKYRMMSSPVYLEFLSGRRELTCTAWGNPTRNVKGWKGPCYLITDEHHASFEELMENTPWEEYGYGKDPRCEHCMMHCGYEPSAALGVNKRLGDSLKMLLWPLACAARGLPGPRGRPACGEILGDPPGGEIVAGGAPVQLAPQEQARPPRRVGRAKIVQ